MELEELLAALPEKEVHGEIRAPISGIFYDSRAILPGGLFVAIPGLQRDGHEFIDEALRNGALVVVAQADRSGREAGGPAVPPERALILVPNSRVALSRLAAAFYAYPGRTLRVIGVTGTDGKTTTCYLINALLERAGYRTGFVTSVAVKVGEELWANETRRTTPEAPELQGLLAQMVSASADYAIVETTSHALALERVRDCEYDVAVFTNLSPEHLDFHGTKEQYLRDKSKLFTLLQRSFPKGLPKVGVINADDESAAYLRTLMPRGLISYGIEHPATLMAQDIQQTPSGTRFTLVSPEREAELTLPLPGLYNVYNALAASSVGVALGLSLDTIREALVTAPQVPGRMERIDEGQGFTVLVDYAHTPAALQQVLQVGRSLTQGRVILVFGCMGGRDTSKRPKMGEIAGRLADFFILTTEDPQWETEEEILGALEAGAKALGRSWGSDYLKVLDRREALRMAFSRAAPGDVVLLTGKGHEQSMLVGDQKLPWDDRRVARELLQEFRPTSG